MRLLVSDIRLIECLKAIGAIAKAGASSKGKRLSNGKRVPVSPVNRHRHRCHCHRRWRSAEARRRKLTWKQRTQGAQAGRGQVDTLLYFLAEAGEANITYNMAIDTPNFSFSTPMWSVHGTTCFKCLRLARLPR